MSTYSTAETNPDATFVDGKFGKGSNFLEFADIITSGTDAKHHEVGRLLVYKVDNADRYVSQMDTYISGFAQLQPSKYQNDAAKIVRNAEAILDRMPRLPQQIEQINVLHEFRHLELEAAARRRDLIRAANEETASLRPPAQHGHACIEDWLMETSSEIQERKDRLAWQSLVEHWPVDTNTLRILLWVASSSPGSDLPVGRQLQKYIDFLVGLFDAQPWRIEEYSSDANEELLQFRKEAIIMWRAYLSNCWQRATMLLVYYTLGAILEEGWSDTWAALLDVRSVFNHNPALMFKQPKYMCGQAVTLLRQSKAAPALDFRKIFERFETAFNDLPARCDPQYSDYRCEYLIPQSCTRFQGQASTPDQSHHESTCDRRACRLVTWDESSYDACRGHSRAVDIHATELLNDAHLLYRAADHTTLAISHVWSHGQGGRPETGFNLCLHRRYSAIAKNYKCSSYWIDTCCIPTDDTRRMEAIRGINGIFSTSRIIVVCDKDLMHIDSNIEHFMETVLATLLVADWNVRGWTLLEGLRGRSNLHLLCANNELVSFTNLCSALYSSGGIDVVTFLPALQHLLPSVSFNYEESGSLLRRRTASRRGDELIIWGLISQDRATKSGESVVQDVQRVRTGFLVSRIPRTDTDGLHWAPAFPSQGYIDGYSVSDGEGSEVGVRCSSGLAAVWLVHHIDRDMLLREEDAGEFFGYGGYSLKQALIGTGLPQDVSLAKDKYEHLALLHPKAEGQVGAYSGRDTTQYMRLVVLCGSHDKKTWRWLDVMPYNFNVSELRLKTLDWGHFAPEEIIFD